MKKTEVAQRNVYAISNLLKKQENTLCYDMAINSISNAKNMIELFNKNWPNSKCKLTIEIESVGLHLLEDLMHDLGGECRNFIGTLKYEGGTIIIKTK